MDYYGLLFLYYLKGLSGKSVLRLFFNIETGGTEQLLPENTSTPTTTPILADIQYPDGLRTDQYFTYRETPTTVSNKARIKTIKGNTLTWNQQHHEQSSTYWSSSNASSSYADGVGTFTASSDGTFGQNLKSAYRYSVIGHKYLFICAVKSSSGGDFNFGLRNAFVTETLSANTEKTVMSIQTATSANDNIIFYRGNATSGDTLTIKNSMCFDLTQMGLDITDPSDFTSLFPLPYYEYNAGTMLSFNGTGIKTTGKNFVDVGLELLKVRNSLGTWNGNEYTYQGVTFKVNLTSEGYIDSVVANGTATANANLNLMRLLRPSTFFNKPITMSGCPSGGSSTTYRMTLQMQTSPYTVVGHDYGNGLNTTIPDNDEDYQAIIRVISGYTCNNVVFKPMITFQGVDQTFEPYTESTLSLPISTYFPSGMKSAGSVYDELTESKAITRISRVDLGSLNWTRWTNGQDAVFLSYSISGFKVTETSIPKCAKYDGVSVANDNLAAFNKGDKTICYRYPTFDRIYIRDDSFTTEADLKASLSGIYLYYELATPTETPITTEDANEALSLLMGKSVSSSNAKQMIDIITKGE